MTRIWPGWVDLLLVALLQVGCEASNDAPSAPGWHGGDSTYVFSAPDDEFTLDDELEEISGLTLMEDGLLGAVQDEEGYLYLLDPTSGQIVERRDFGTDGDYEGIELAGGRLYILRSDGRLYVFDEWVGEEIEGESRDLDLVKGCDAEGIAYQRQFERLLIACKERAGKGLDDMKAIFAYDLSSQTLAEEPVILLDTKAFEASTEDHPVNEAVQSILSDHVDLSGLKPSGLATHPITGDLYVVSSVAKVVLRVDNSGAVTAMWSLPSNLFAQPEGIAFEPNGDMFISNEAGGRRHATLLRFRYRSAAASPSSSNE